jgi:hypothetical protein
LQPVDGAHIQYGERVTLMVAGTLSDGAIFEVARDPSFTGVWLMFTYARRWCGSVGLAGQRRNTGNQAVHTPIKARQNSSGLRNSRWSRCGRHFVA